MRALQVLTEPAVIAVQQVPAPTEHAVQLREVDGEAVPLAVGKQLLGQRALGVHRLDGLLDSLLVASGRDEVAHADGQGHVLQPACGHGGHALGVREPLDID